MLKMNTRDELEILMTRISNLNISGRLEKYCHRDYVFIASFFHIRHQQFSTRNIKSAF